MKKRYFIIKYFLLIVMMLIFSSGLNGQEIPVITYAKTTFIDFNYTFANNEALNVPIQVRENPVTKEIVVLDLGNNCLYFFSLQGKFIRKKGQAGQGPGDLLKPVYMTICQNGDIYVYEFGNLRISMFNSTGKFIDSFKIQYIMPNSFSVNSDGEAIISHPHTGYYITVYSKKGKPLKYIGKLPSDADVSNFKSPQDAAKYSGFPLKLSNGNYCIFLSTLYYVKIFKEPDILVKEITYDKVFPQITDYNTYINDLKESELNILKKSKGRQVPMMRFFIMDVIYKNNRIYYDFDTYSSSNNDLNSKNSDGHLYVLNNDLEIEQKIDLIKSRIFIQKPILITKCGFDILSSNSAIIYPNPTSAKIYISHIIK